MCCTGMNKVEEKLKAGRKKRAEGALFTEESKRKKSVHASTRKEAAVISSGLSLSLSLSLSLHVCMIKSSCTCVLSKQCEINN